MSRDPRPSDVSDRELVESLQISISGQCAAYRNTGLRIAKLQSARLRGRLLCRLKKTRITIAPFRGVLYKKHGIGSCGISHTRGEHCWTPPAPEDGDDG